MGSLTRVRHQKSPSQDVESLPGSLSPPLPRSACPEWTGEDQETARSSGTLPCFCQQSNNCCWWYVISSSEQQLPTTKKTTSKTCNCKTFLQREKMPNQTKIYRLS